MGARVWCWTPNPVLEIKFSRHGRFVSAGGKAHNVARQLRLWGVPTVSVVPQSGTGWHHAAKKDRVQIREISVRSAARTGWALIEGPGRRLDFFTEDPRWSPQAWSPWGHFFRQRLREGDWLVVAGSVPSGARSGWWRTLFLGLKQKGIRIFVDGRGPLLLEALRAGVDWAKANQAEAEESLNCRGTAKCLAKMQRLSRGRSCLVITRGSRGLVVRSKKETIAVPAPRIRLQDATGSGDVVTAAFIVGIRKGWEIGKTAGFAVWAGSEQAARRDGAVARLKGRGVLP